MPRNKLNTLLKSNKLTAEEVGLLFIDDLLKSIETGNELFSTSEKSKIVSCLDKSQKNMHEFNKIVCNGGVLDQLKNMLFLMRLGYVEASRIYLTICMGLNEHRLGIKTIKKARYLNLQNGLSNKDLQNLTVDISALDEMPASTYSKLIRQSKYTKEIAEEAMKHYSSASILYTSLSIFADKYNKEKIREMSLGIKLITDFDAHQIGLITDDIYDDIYNDETINLQEREDILNRVDELSEHTLIKVIDKSLIPAEARVKKATQYVEDKRLGQIELSCIKQILEDES